MFFGGGDGGLAHGPMAHGDVMQYANNETGRGGLGITGGDWGLIRGDVIQ